MARSIKELREKYIELGLKGDKFEDLSKKELKDIVEAAESAENILNSVEVSKKGELVPQEDGDLKSIDNTVDTTPSMTDPGWNDYVMTLFQEKELENGMPKTDALRRIGDRLLKGIIRSITDVVQVPTIDNAGRATVIVTLEFGCGMVVSAAADVFSGNTEKTYAAHPVATAETRAEGRALRKALRLTKILSAEELQNAEPDESGSTDRQISSGMINNLRVMADRVKADVQKVATKLGFNVDVLEDLTQKQGLDIAKQLGKYGRKEEDVTDEVGA